MNKGTDRLQLGFPTKCENRFEKIQFFLRNFFWCESVQQKTKKCQISQKVCEKFNTNEKVCKIRRKIFAEFYIVLRKFSFAGNPSYSYSDGKQLTRLQSLHNLQGFAFTRTDQSRLPSVKLTQHVKYHNFVFHQICSYNQKF